MRADHGVMVIAAVYVVLAAWYATERDWGRVVYWIGATIIVIGTLMMGRR